MSASNREAAVADLLVNVSATLTEGAAMAAAQRDSTIQVIVAYQRMVDKAPVDLAAAALVLVGNAEHLPAAIGRLADQVGAMALHLQQDGRG